MSEDELRRVYGLGTLITVCSGTGLFFFRQQAEQTCQQCVKVLMKLKTKSPLNHFVSFAIH